MFKPLLLASLIAALPSVTLAANTMTVGRGTEVIAVNGIPVDSPLFIGKVEDLQLPDGANQIAVRATQLVKDANITKKFASQVHVLTFSAQNQALDISAPTLATWQSGVEFDKKPNWQLTHNGQPVSYQHGMLTSLTNMAVLRNFGDELDAFNRSNQPAALASLAGAMQGQNKNLYDIPNPKSATHQVNAHALAPIVPAGSNAQQVRQLFEKMSASEKRDFISWAAQQL